MVYTAGRQAAKQHANTLQNAEGDHVMLVPRPRNHGAGDRFSAATDRLLKLVSLPATRALRACSNAGSGDQSICTSNRVSRCTANHRRTPRCGQILRTGYRDSHTFPSMISPAPRPVPHVINAKRLASATNPRPLLAPGCRNRVHIGDDRYTITPRIEKSSSNGRAGNRSRDRKEQLHRSG